MSTAVGGVAMPTIIRRILNKAVISSYRIFELAGYHVLPANWQYPIPQSSALTDELFDSTSECIGIDWNLSEQERYLNEIFPDYAQEASVTENSGLSLVDAAILHAMIRHHNPKKIVEIGGGSSTQIAAGACLMNSADRLPSELITIEPHPGPVLRDGIPGLSDLIRSNVEDVELKRIIDCDLLFIDSSHFSQTGSDVNYEILEIIPRLKPGSIIHWHDVLLPGEYWKSWVKDEHRFYNEQYLIHAFLEFNSEFEILWASRYMHLKQPDRIKEVFPYFQPDYHHIMSLWIRRKEAHSL